MLTNARIRRIEAYADWKSVYREETQRGSKTPVKQSTPIPGAMPRGKTRQGT